ncbi:MAG TPA: ribose-5-phosphate isomerase RpiA [Ignavibacteriaceae bacterium]|nr:ribose-5-phosphate isomerase RpiA [Ignavibacteriaceae bacterium]
MKEKKIAAEAAVEFVEDGMIVGLGTGSTVGFFINGLVPRIKAGLKITAVSTSQKTTELAKSIGIELINLNEADEIDLTVDGADEVDKDLNGIKGGGGALLYEKIVAGYSKKNIWIIDSTKLVETLGKFPLPVEVMKFGCNQLLTKLEMRGYNPKFRMNNNNYFITDSNHYIIDLYLGRIDKPETLDREIKSFPGVVETGLFIDFADVVIVGRGEKVEIINKGLK